MSHSKYRGHISDLGVVFQISISYFIYFQTYFNMIEVSPTNPFITTENRNERDIGNDVAYIFDYIRPNSIYQSTHGLRKGSPQKWENQLAIFFKKNVARWTKNNFTSPTWQPLNNEPMKRQTVSIESSVQHTSGHFLLPVYRFFVDFPCQNWPRIELKIDKMD